MFGFFPGRDEKLKELLSSMEEFKTKTSKGIAAAIDEGVKEVARKYDLNEEYARRTFITKFREALQRDAAQSADYFRRTGKLSTEAPKE